MNRVEGERIPEGVDVHRAITRKRWMSGEEVLEIAFYLKHWPDYGDEERLSVSETFEGACNLLTTYGPKTVRLSVDRIRKCPPLPHRIVQLDVIATKSDPPEKDPDHAEVRGPVDWRPAEPGSCVLADYLASYLARVANGIAA